MLDGPSVVAALTECGVTHAVWIPDSELGKWEPALAGASGISRSVVKVASAARALSSVSKSRNECWMSSSPSVLRDQ